MIAALAGLAVLVPSCYLPPVNAPIVDPFRAPACSYCPGNRGLEYAPRPGTRVVAAAPGLVTFSGLVAGVRYVVVAQSDGRTATYGRLAATPLALGATVQASDVIGTTTDRFFFGLRQDGRYIDPAPFIGRFRYRPRLVPIDGSPPRRPPPPTISCATAHLRR